MFPEVEMPKEHCRLQRCAKDHRRTCHQDLAGVNMEMLDMLGRREHTELKGTGT